MIDTEDSNTTLFSDIMFEHCFYPHINLPTRITTTSATCIDHIWSNIYDCDVVSGIFSETISDHMITFQCSDINISKPINNAACKGYQKTDFNLLSAALLNIQTNDIMSCEDLDISYAMLEHRVSQCIDLHENRDTEIKT